MRKHRSKRNCPTGNVVTGRGALLFGKGEIDTGMRPKVLMQLVPEPNADNHRQFKRFFEYWGIRYSVADALRNVIECELPLEALIALQRQDWYLTVESVIDASVGQQCRGAGELTEKAKRFRRLNVQQQNYPVLGALESNCGIPLTGKGIAA